MFDKFLLWSVKNEYIILTRFALWLGANPNVKDKDGNTLLHILVDSKNIKTAEKIADILDKKGIDIYAKNDKSQTPIEYAVSKKNTTITKWLVTQYKADKTKDFDYAKNLKETLIKLALDTGMRKPSEDDKNIASILVDGLRGVHGYKKSKLQEMSENIRSRLPADSTNPLFELISNKLCQGQMFQEGRNRNTRDSELSPKKSIQNLGGINIMDIGPTQSRGQTNAPPKIRPDLIAGTKDDSSVNKAPDPSNSSPRSTTTPTSSRSRGSSGKSSPSSLGR